MNITILTLGSRGDVQPYVALGRGLAGAGHELTIATHACWEAFVAEYTAYMQRTGRFLPRVTH